MGKGFCLLLPLCCKKRLAQLSAWWGEEKENFLLAFELVTFLLQSGRLPRESRVVLGAFE